MNFCEKCGSGPIHEKRINCHKCVKNKVYTWDLIINIPLFLFMMYLLFQYISKFKVLHQNTPYTFMTNNDTLKVIINYITVLLSNPTSTWVLKQFAVWAGMLTIMFIVNRVISVLINKRNFKH